MIANPRDYGYEPLDVEAEWLKVQGALAELEGQGLVEVTRLEAATLSALQRQLRRDSYNIFHFVGHGGFDEQTQSGVLLLEDEAGRSRTVSGHYLGALLRDHFSLRLALLNACEGARTSKADPFAGVAQQLVHQGIPAVIAMQFEITDGAAITLAHEFYGAVADGYGVDAALSEARKALYAAENDIEWGTPVLYMRAVDGDLFDLAAFERTRQAVQPANQDEATHAAPTTRTAPQDPVVDADAALANPASGLDQPVGEPTNTIAEQTPPDRDSTASAVQEEQRRTLAETQSTRENPPRVAPATKPHSKPQTVSTPKRRWWRVVVALIALIGVIYFTVVGIDNYQTPQRQYAQATVAMMVAAIPEAQRLVDDYGMYFVEVPAGEFRMGSTQAEIDAALALCQQYYDSCSRDWFTDEAEQHTIPVDAFWIMQTEVTNAQFAAFVEADGYALCEWCSENGITEPRYWHDPDWNGPDYPVVGISWYEAMAYAAWLADKTELEIRLPTEAEWEKAARGTEGLIFPWGNEWDGAFLNYCDENCTNSWKDEAVNDGYVTTAPVGSYPGGASPYGALDMAGNVWEWTSSQDVAYPYDSTDGREEPEGDARRVLRGGSWRGLPGNVRAAARLRFNPGSRFDDAGVRLVLAVAPR